MSRKIAFFLFVLFLGCGKQRVELLTDRADAYNRSLRWSSLTAASTLIADDVRRTMMQKLGEHLGRHRIVDYAIVDLSVDPESTKGSIVVQYSFYGIVNQDLKHQQQLQSWEWDRGKKNWFLKESQDLGPAQQATGD